MRPVERVLEKLEVASGPDSRGEYLAFCPAHDDRNTPNLRIREAGDADGRVLLRCFAGCGQNEVLAALAERGIGKKDLFAGGRKEREGGEGGCIPPRNHVHACTRTAYAEAKGLPLGFLRSLGLSDIHYSGRPAVRIPYLDEEGSEIAVRFRLALQKSPGADERFRWRKGSRPTLYGLWRLRGMRSSGYAFLVEGESDCHTLWHHGLPAFGVPGASTWRKEWAEHLEGLDRIYAVVEPDSGGEALRSSTAFSSSSKPKGWRASSRRT